MASEKENIKIHEGQWKGMDDPADATDEGEEGRTKKKKKGLSASSSLL